MFHAWVTRELLLKLLPACVIVMDYAGFHKQQDIKIVFVNAGHTLEYRLSYSPNFNDIEPKWTQTKTIRKRKALPSSGSLPSMHFATFYIEPSISDLKFEE
ncbi:MULTISPECIES: transposase [Nitrosomonas]|uniref:transposase n=1 Tax=Nitrosomonas TaxID=914 RepID=UPI0009E56E17